METIEITVEIPNTELAKEALDKTVVKIIKAHRAANPEPAVTVVEEPVEPEQSEADDKSFKAVITKDLTDKDVKKIIKDNDLGMDTRRNISVLRKEIEALPNAIELINAFKEAELA